MRTATEQWFPDASDHCLVAVGCAVVVSVNNLHLFVKTDTSTRGLAWWLRFCFPVQRTPLQPLVRE